MLSLQRHENLRGEEEEKQDEKKKKNRWSVPVLQDVLASGQSTSLEKGCVNTGSGIKNLAVVSGKHTFTFLKLRSFSVITAGCQYFITELSLHLRTCCPITGPRHYGKVLLLSGLTSELKESEELVCQRHTRDHLRVTQRGFIKARAENKSPFSTNP